MKNPSLNRITQIILGLIFLAALFIILFPTRTEIFESVSVFAPQLMFFLLILSFILLVFNQKSLMLIGLLSTALIALYLKTASNNNFILPAENSNPKTQVVLLNLENASRKNADILNIVAELDADILVFQYYTQEWDSLIGYHLVQAYPFAHKLKRDDGFGIAIYSRRKIYKIDNFYYRGVPNLKVEVDNNNSKLSLISSYIPQDYPRKEEPGMSHLEMLISEIKDCRYPVIVLGNFNKMYWSNVMIGFMEATSLENSRRSISIDYLNPVDHIFYSERLECTEFQELKNSENRHLGIKGSYQLTQ